MITCIFIDKYLEGVRSALALIWGRRMMFFCNILIANVLKTKIRRRRASRSASRLTSKFAEDVTTPAMDLSV